MGIHRLWMKGNSRLIIQEVNGEFILKEIALVTCQTVVQKLVKSFYRVLIEHSPRAHNKHTDGWPFWLKILRMMR